MSEISEESESVESEASEWEQLPSQDRSRVLGNSIDALNHDANIQLDSVLDAMENPNKTEAKLTMADIIRDIK